MSHPIEDKYLINHIGILGKSRSGKSIVAKGFVEQLVKSGKRVCVIDPKGNDWWGLRAEGLGQGLPVLIVGGEHGDVPITPESGENVAQFIHENHVPVVIDIGDFSKTEQIKFVFYFTETIFKLNRTPLHLVIDEADQFIPQKLSEGGLEPKLVNRMSRLVRQGGSKGFRITLITQRPAVISKDVLTQIETLVCMRMTGPNDQKPIADWLTNMVTPKQAKEHAAGLARLATGTGWICSPVEDRMEKLKFPMCQTFDAGRTPKDGEEVLEPKSLADIDTEALTSVFIASNEDEKIDLGPGVVRMEEYNVAVAKLQNELTAANERIQLLTYQLEYATQKMESMNDIGMEQRQKLEAIHTWFEAGDEILSREEKLSSDAKYLPPFEDIKKVTMTVGNSMGKTEDFVHLPASINNGTKNIDEYLAPNWKSARKMLVALGQLYPRQVPRRTFAALAGVSTTSSTFRPNLKALIDAQLVESNGDLFHLTELGTQFTPCSQAHTLEDWISRYSPTAGAMLRVLHRNPARKMCKDEIAIDADFSPTSSSVGNGLRELVLDGLIIKHADRTYSISEVLNNA